MRTYFREAIATAMREENLGLTIDAKGAVHFAVDAEYEALRSATVAGLDAAPLLKVRELFETAYRHMDEPRDLTAAVRGIFECVRGSSPPTCAEAPKPACEARGG